MRWVRGAPVHPSEVFKGALLANAQAIIVGHNHPSGDVLPFDVDRLVVERLRQLVEVLDALIVGPKDRFYLVRGRGPSRVEALKVACRAGLLQDIGEVLERQGKEAIVSQRGK